MVTAYQVQVRGDFGGTSGDWRPAICGTLNQTEFSDELASVAYSESDAHGLIAIAMGEGASEQNLRYVVGTVLGVAADGFTALAGETPRFVAA